MNEDEPISELTPHQVVAQQLGTLFGAVGLLAATLHTTDLFDARAYARTLRVNPTDDDIANGLRNDLADMIERTIDKYESEGPYRPKPV